MPKGGDVQSGSNNAPVERTRATTGSNQLDFGSRVHVENRTRVVRMGVGSGNGDYCAYCHKQINADAVEYEVDAYVAAGLRNLHFHRICFHLWETLP